MLWLRWAWRDLRARWVQVVCTALALSVGIGAFAGLAGLREWRDSSVTESLATLRAHDLRVDLPDGAFADAGSLSAALRRLPSGAVAAAEERLVAESQLDASRRGKPVLVPARLVGIPVRRGGQPVEAVSVNEGRGLSAASGSRTAVLDFNFASHYGLPASGSVRLAGLGKLPYTGLGVTPQHFLIVGDAGMSGAESGLAIVYLPLSAAQRATGRPDAVNQLLVRAAPGQDVKRLERELRSALAAGDPDTGVSITRGEEEPVTRILFSDARNDQKMFTALAIILLAAAALATFNLVSRAVEAQRREIGIGMALGVEPRVLAVRPLVLGLQIGALGAALGIPVGIGLAEVIKGLIRDFLPLPVYASTFPADLYVAGALIGVAIPLLAAALPVRRAIGVQPVEAISTGSRAGPGGGVTALLRRARFPGRPLVQLPLRNLARTPRRTAMTMIGLGAVITAVVAVLGMVDSMGDVADRQEAEVLTSSPTRLDVALTRIVAANGAEVRRVADAPGVRRAEAGLTVDAAVRAGGVEIPIALTFSDPQSDIWHPTVTEGQAVGDGILLANKAADDLGVSVGDTVVLRHPRRSVSATTLADTRVRVKGIHGNPIRAYAYVSARSAAKLGLGGLASTVTVVPEPGTAPGTLEQDLFGRAGIAFVRPAAAEAASLRAVVDEFSAAIQIVAFITLGLALLVAFTSTSVSVEERRREYATMFAFGLLPRTGLRVAMVESLVVGVLGTVLGLAFGLIVAGWIVNVLMPDTLPDLGARMALSGGSIVTTLAVGILAVGLAPLFTYRRMRRMDIPSALRVVE